MSGSATDSASREAEPSGDRGPSPRVPDFDLLRPIGRGGFGEVWLATNRTTGRLRAVKVIPLKPAGATDPAGREISSIARLEASVQAERPHLLTIHHVGKTADFLFYVMDPADDVAGGPASADPGYRPATLRSRLQNGPLSPDECFSCARQLLAGLVSLHEAGMVHRDVKPENCLFVDGELKLADFGLVTGADMQSSRVGTQKYMPPDGRMDTRADVYAAGLVIYEMVAGLPADRFPRLGDRAHDVVDDPVLSRLNRVALQACQPDPRERYRDAGRMLGQLTATGPPRPRPRPRSRRIAAAIACLLVALLVAASPWWLRHVPLVGHRGVDVNFITRPFNATVYLDDVLQTDPNGTPYLTPCTIPNVPRRVHHVRLEHEALGEWEGEIDFAQSTEIVAEWDMES
ncbi:MAG TPA: serine/threonine-protein kinase [Thermoguttaceae bacterium]|nr:serine/threonine-protein kinase [Thermoguttaceae bacterium]